MKCGYIPMYRKRVYFAFSRLNRLGLTKFSSFTFLCRKHNCGVNLIFLGNKRHLQKRLGLPTFIFLVSADLKYQGRNRARYVGKNENSISKIQ